jgi:Gpi18-like mannosyltransferase
MNPTASETREPIAATDRVADTAVIPNVPSDLAASDLQATASRRKWSTAAVLAAVLLIGLTMRAWIVATPGLGLEDDLRIFASWSRNLADNGLARFYATQRFCDYPPLGVLVFYSVGKAANALGGGQASEELLRAALKVPACLADLGIALLIFVEARRLLGRRAGAAAAALYFLNPVTLYDSAYWGQVDAIYTFFALLALVLVSRRHWHWAGAAAAAGLLAKFQTIAVVPLLLFETYRLGGRRAIAGKLVSALAMAAVVTAPFALTNTLTDVLQRGYVNVVGQYKQLSKGAFNTWSFVAPPDTTDAAPPISLARLAAAGQTQIPADSSWLLALTWRRISLLVYALSVAVVLAVYSLRPGPIARYGAAALLGLAFFLFPTEMHERYAFPVLAFLALWAVSSEWKERTFFLVSAMLLLNLAFVLPPGQLAPQIAAVTLLLFGIVLVGLARRHASTRSRAASPASAETDVKARGSQRLIAWFRWATLAAVVILAAGATSLAVMAARAPSPTPAPNTIYLSDLHAESVHQSWHSLALDRAVAGGPLQLGGTVYLRGLGTHAPSRIEYAIPPDATAFCTRAGIDHGTGGPGSAIFIVELDGKPVFKSPIMTWQSEPLDLEIPLRNAKRLVLRTNPTRDGQRADHADWALARFELRAVPATQLLPIEDLAIVTVFAQASKILDGLRSRAQSSTPNLQSPIHCRVTALQASGAAAARSPAPSPAPPPRSTALSDTPAVRGGCTHYAADRARHPPRSRDARFAIPGAARSRAPRQRSRRSSGPRSCAAPRAQGGDVHRTPSAHPPCGKSPESLPLRKPTRHSQAPAASARLPAARRSPPAAPRRARSCRRAE